MRHRLHILVTILSCSILFLTEGCKTEDTVYQDDANAKDDPASPPAVDDTIVPVVVNPPLPGPEIVEQVPVFFPPTVGEGRGARTGNPDRQPDPGPSGVCFNGVQEVLPDSLSCPFFIYGATTDGPDGLSNLVGFNANSQGQGSLIDVIGPDIERVSAIDFSPQGILYGVGELSTANDASVIFSINCQTGEVSNVLTTGIANLPGLSEVITDIDFDSFGRLWAYVTTSTGDEFFGYINLDTGAFNLVGETGQFDQGNGIGTTPFPNDILFHTSADELRIIDRSTGISSLSIPLLFSAPATSASRINAIDADPFTDIVYVSINNGNDENYLGTLNVLSGEVSFLSNAPIIPEAPDGLDAIAVSRRYEECDPEALFPFLPLGTSCTQDCQLEETDCGDLLDDDNDGFVDCADIDCLDRPCNDQDGCTINTFCVEASPGGEARCAAGEERVCNDGIECTRDTCVGIDNFDDSFACVFDLDPEKTAYGSCTPNLPENCEDREDDGSCDPDQVINACLVGRCVEALDSPVDFICEAANKVSLPLNTAGLRNDNCPFDLYGTRILAAGVTQLIGFDLDDNGGSNVVGTIVGVPALTNVRAIEFGLDGTLYGVGQSGGVNVLLTIDCEDATADVVGPTNIATTLSAGASITDLDIGADGRMFAFAIETNDEGNLGEIDISTGAFTLIGLTNVVDPQVGNGLGSTDSGLFLATDVAIRTLNTNSGALGAGGLLAFTNLTNPRLVALDVDPLTGIMYGAAIGDDSPTEDFLVTVNVATGQVLFLSDPAVEVPDGLAGLTVNRLGIGCNDLNSCTGDSCNDGICVFGALHGNPCTDGNACTTNDTCDQGTCVGTNVPVECADDADCGPGLDCVESACVCDDGNDCTDDDECNGDGNCVGDVDPTNACDDQNECTGAGTCDDGALCRRGTALPGGACDSGLQCIDATCDGGFCVPDGIPNDNDCPTGDDCIECSCGDDGVCGCDFVSGPSDNTCDLNLVETIVIQNATLGATLFEELSDLGLENLECDFGVEECFEGVLDINSCILSPGEFTSLSDVCNETTLDIACDGGDVTPQAAVFICEAMAIVAPGL